MRTEPDEPETLEQRAARVLAFLRNSDTWTPTAIIRVAHPYTDGTLGGTLARLLHDGTVKRRHGRWRACNPTELRRRGR